MMLFFHAFRYVEFRLKNKTLHANLNARVASRPGLLVQMVVNAWGVLIREHLDMSFSDDVQNYMFLAEGTGYSSSSCPVLMGMLRRTS